MPTTNQTKKEYIVDFKKHHTQLRACLCPNLLCQWSAPEPQSCKKEGWGRGGEWWRERPACFRCPSSWLLMPSICTRTSVLTLLEASCSPAWPLEAHKLSISSMKMVVGAIARAISKRHLTIRSLSPLHSTSYKCIIHCKLHTYCFCFTVHRTSVSIPCDLHACYSYSCLSFGRWF